MQISRRAPSALLLVAALVLVSCSARTAGRDAGVATDGGSGDGGQAPIPTALARVWAIDGGEKIARGDLAFPLADSPKNAVWDGHTIHVFGAKNEIVPFQVILQAKAGGAKAVDVTMSALVSGSATIGNTGSPTDPYDYVGRHLALYREHYVHLTKRSHTSWTSSYYASWYGRPQTIHATSYKDTSDAANFIGWYPDGLVPLSVGTAKGGAPFDIAGNENQGVWVDVTIPRDAPAGTYTGSLRILEGGKTTRTIPVALKVLPFALPDETHLKGFWETMPQDLEARFGVARGSAAYDTLVENFEKLFHRDRVDMNVDASLDEVKSFYSRFLSGVYFNAANGYAGPGTGAGATMYSIGTYDQSPGSSSSGWRTGFVDTESKWWQAADDWYTYFHLALPGVEVFKYMDDEPCRSAPNCNDWSTLSARDQAEITDIETHGKWHLANPGPGKALPLFDTARPDLSFIKPYITYWADAGEYGADGPPHYDFVGEIPTVHSEGEKLGTYGGTWPFEANFDLDVPAAAVTSIAWVTWKYHLDFFFYWYTNDWPAKGSVLDDPTPGTNTSSAPDWGDGIVVYPGSEVGLDGPLPSIRLENWRTGAQEYEYLSLAKKLGVPASALDPIVNGVVGDALSGATDRTSPPPFSVRGYAYEAARRKLAALIAARL